MQKVAEPIRFCHFLVDVNIKLGKNAKKPANKSDMYPVFWTPLKI